MNLVCRTSFADYLDEIRQHLKALIDKKSKPKYENERVPNTKFCLKLNVQTGGWATKDLDLSKPSDFFKVDYVRAWQHKIRK